jgi:hypothetical protein
VKQPLKVATPHSRCALNHNGSATIEFNFCVSPTIADFHQTDRTLNSRYTGGLS